MAKEIDLKKHETKQEVFEKPDPDNPHNKIKYTKQLSIDGKTMIEVPVGMKLVESKPAFYGNQIHRELVEDK